MWEGDNLVRNILIDPDDTNRIFASTGIFDSEPANSDENAEIPGGVGILRSFDGGASWEELDEKNGLKVDELYLGTLDMHPDDSDILLTAADSAPYVPILDRELGGVYRTEDGGDTWTEVSPYPANAVGFCSGNPDVAYAIGGSISRSTNGGKTWELISEGWGPPGINVGIPIDVECDPRDEDRVFVNNYGGGNFISEDGGESWANASKGYTGARMSDVAVSMSDANIAYVSGRTGVFRTDDAGQTWEGIAYNEHLVELAGLSVDPGDDDHVILSFDGPRWPVQTFDAGKTWQVSDLSHLFGDPTNGQMVPDFVFSPGDSEVIIGAANNLGCWAGHELGGCYAQGGGLIYSHDNGQTWNHSNITDKTVLSATISPAEGAAMYASVFEGGVYRSDDEGKTWSLVNDNPLDGEADDRMFITVDVDDDQKIFGGLHDGGVAISEDGGKTWDIASSGMDSEANVIGIVVDPNDSQVVYASATNAGVYVSTDGGSTWTPMNEGLIVKATTRMSLSAGSDVLWVGTIGAGVFQRGG
ncbi:MAG: hypothetical protein HN348_25135 [Proteobacteria bacterium]|nr:hypothetical protein [Pseudomonadota bacterium]